MTRGQFVIITNDKVFSSCEFNGDMYYEGHGEEVIERLKNVKTVKDFEREVSEFNDENFQYNGDLVLEAQNPIDFSVDYFDNWFSDYLYIKNISNKANAIVDAGGKSWKIKPNEIKVFCFGEPTNIKESVRKSIKESVPFIKITWYDDFLSQKMADLIRDKFDVSVSYFSDFDEGVYGIRIKTSDYNPKILNFIKKKVGDVSVLEESKKSARKSIKEAKGSINFGDLLSSQVDHNKDDANVLYYIFVNNKEYGNFFKWEIYNSYRELLQLDVFKWDIKSKGVLSVNLH